MINYIFPIIISLFLVFISTPITILLARRLKLLDDVTKRKHPANTHKGIIPRAGGLAIFVGIFIAAILFIEVNKIIFGVLLGASLIVLIGLIDDYLDLSPYLRFILNIIVVLIVIFFGLGIPYLTNPFGGVIRLDTFTIPIDFFGHHTFLLFANLFSLIWIVGMINFINWSSGVDGQMSGFVGISCFFLGILAFRFTGHDISSVQVALLAFITGGAFLGFLPWNFYPQKIMPGYSGGALGGFMLGVLSILSWGKIGTLALVLSVPLVDAFYVIARRLRHRQSPFRGDAGHFHHRLLEIGWGRRRIAVFYWLVSLMFGFGALLFQREQKVLGILIVTIMLAVFILIIEKVKVRVQQPPLS